VFAKPRLMVPGPSPVPPEVAAMACLPVQDERTAAFAEIFLRVLSGLRYVIATENEVLLTAGSGTSGMESCVQNLFSPGERVLVASNGYFGDRWAQICEAHGLQVTSVAHPWGAPIDWDRVGCEIKKGEVISGAFCVHCETSTGMVNDVSAFREAVSPAITVVDAIASAGACELQADYWGLDVIVGACQKALMTPPGLTFTSISDRAWAAHQRAASPRYYLDWTMARDALSASPPRTPWTPPVVLITQLDAALAAIQHEKLPEVIHRHALLAKATRAGASAMGMAVLSPDSDDGSPVTAAFAPSQIDAEDLLTRLSADYGVQLAGGQGRFARKLVRIGHCGYADQLDVVGALFAIESCLRRLGLAVSPGAGAAAAGEVFAGES
jgi:aspartate aminotransferase-like enzyme